ncbi:hypothetical protein [Paracidobacterium acidisoli]|uniref:Uncharacterized protein n=1 Tax=Paracidobacterium acidisoli TaxID=2303751 RepID=A0A372IRE4_9BACT|nr:hypothetical protein [Paracidobacterium acidisoli]MBT9330356.1 hypothetical protein [Paracidobacterium acidisoli]
MTKPAVFRHDSDVRKGAQEEEAPSNPALRPDADHRLGGQLSHRETDDLIKESDTDFPEPGSNPEHTGQR